MKLVIHEQNQAPRTCEVRLVNGLRVVTDNGVFLLKPLANLSAQMVDSETMLPAFRLLEIIRLHDEFDGSRHCYTTVERVYVSMAQKKSLSAEKKPRFRALFYLGDKPATWLLEDFQQVAPLMGETVAPTALSGPKKPRKLVWWHDSELTNIKGTAKQGKEFVVPISAALREVLKVLLETPGEPVPQKRLNERISKSRNTQDYRSAKILRSAEAEKLFNLGVLQKHKPKGVKAVCYSVAPPSEPPEP